jgi:hypothetical protein
LLRDFDGFSFSSSFAPVTDIGAFVLLLLFVAAVPSV